MVFQEKPKRTPIPPPSCNPQGTGCILLGMLLYPWHPAGSGGLQMRFGLLACADVTDQHAGALIPMAIFEEEG